MSEEQIKEALEQEELPNEPELEQEEEHDDLPDLNPIEQKAWDQGWRPQDEFGGNPDNWKTAGEYNLYGEMQEHVREAKAETRRKEAEFDVRIENLNKLHEAQKTAAISDLKVQQRQAVEEADTAEFDRLQGQIEEHQKVEPTPNAEPAKDPLIQDWEDKNPWINDPESEKAQQAIALYNIAAGRPGATVKSALGYAEEQLAKLYPSETPTNLRREMPTMTEQSSRPSGRRRSKELTMDDLTASERTEWQQFGSIMFSSEKDFLKTVADARKEK